MYPANAHFQRWLVLDVAIPIRFPLPSGNDEHLAGLRVVVQDFQDRPAEHSALAATMGNLHHAVSEEPASLIYSHKRPLQRDVLCL